MANKRFKVLTCLACDVTHQEVQTKGSLVGVYATRSLFVSPDMDNGFTPITFWLQLEITPGDDFEMEFIFESKKAGRIFQGRTKIPALAAPVIAMDFKDLLIPIRPPDQISLRLREKNGVFTKLTALQIDFGAAPSGQNFS